MEELKSILVTKVSKDRYCLAITWEGKRYRFYSGEKIGIDSKPNQLPTSDRKTGFNHLKRQYLNCINKGWTPELDWSPKPIKQSPKNILRLALDEKLKGDYSYHYKKKLTWMVAHFEKYCKGRTINEDLVVSYLNDHRWSGAMRNNLRSHFLSLVTHIQKQGLKIDFKMKVKKERVVEAFHKPIKNLTELLEEIKEFDSDLYLCCLLTYACLLRPHREIRLLTWGDFNDELTLITLSGSQTKGKRNRIVPIPSLINKILLNKRGDIFDCNSNIFSNSYKPFSIGYFNNKWTRFRHISRLIQPKQTIYSFRHTGAINVYEKSKSIFVLQKALDHSSIVVSIKYLRGIQMDYLSINDMPSL